MGVMTAKMRISIGLTCLSASVLLVAVFIGMVPDRRVAVLDGRRKLCEAVAVNSSILVSTKDVARLEAVLNTVVERNDDILSAGIRRPGGNLEIEIGPHQALWQDMTAERPVDDQLQVPLRAGKTKWGMVELRFRSSSKIGWMGVLTSPIVLLATFCSCGSFVVFMIYLGKMLQHLDPSQAVPRRVRSALDTLAEGLLVIDKAERIVLANQALGSWVERDPSRLLGHKISELPWVSDKGESLDEYPWSRSLSEGCQLAGIVMGIKKGKDGDVRSLMVNATPVLGQDGDYRGVLISLDDVTQLETTKRELQVSKVAAEDANRAKSDFLARMSHEIRTPMNAILGYTDVLRQGYDETTTDRQEYLDTIHVSGEHLLALINDILDLSKIEAGHLELELQPVAPYPLFAHVVSVFRAKAAEKDIQLDFECDGPIPATIQTDPVRLRQTVMNLVGNAIKFTTRGGVRVVTRITDDNGKPQLAIDVTDTGIGISKAAIDSIFDPFSQADTSITRRFGGTGLGLAISLQLAEAMGGGVTVKSTPGEGSTFTVTIDTGSLDGISLLSGAEAKAASEQRAAQPSKARTLPPGQILVVDDGEANRKLLKLVLGRAGMTVVTAENGKEAVQAARAQTFDVILMDMQMPVMDGYAATTTLRTDGYTLPIIALTAHVMQSDEAKCREAGCSGFLTKPVNMDDLFTVIVEQMGVEAGTAETQAEPNNENPKLDAELPPGEAASRGEQIPLEPLFSTLPMDDADFREIVAIFVERLKERVEAMFACWEQRDFEVLGNHVHWLKGSAGTAGFADFSPVADDLRQAVRDQRIEAISPLLVDISNLVERISIDAPDSSSLPDTCETPPSSPLESPLTESSPLATDVMDGGDPVHSTLPTEEPEFLEIVVEFVEKLHAKLAAMQSAFDAGQWDELARSAHWMRGSGGTAGFHEFTDPSRELEKAVKTRDITGATQSLARLRAIAKRIDVPEVCEPTF